MMNGIPKAVSGCGNFLFKLSGITIFVIAIIVSSGKDVMANNTELIESSVLNGELSKWVVLDARPKSEWVGGHIPGAVSLSWDNFTRTDGKGIPFKVWPPEELAAALGEMGISEQTPIVIYGDADKSSGGEGWDVWMFTWMGHKGPIRLLSGGIQAWRNRNLPVTTDAGKEKPARMNYAFTLQPQFDISTAEIEQKKSSLSLIDTRSMSEWLLGRIPGATHIQWTEFFTGPERRPLNAAELAKLLKDNGVDTAKPIVYYCRGGIRSGYAWMVHRLSGLPDARNYEGGMEAWRKLSTR